MAALGGLFQNLSVFQVLRIFFEPYALRAQYCHVYPRVALTGLHVYVAFIFIFFTASTLLLTQDNRPSLVRFSQSQATNHRSVPRLPSVLSH